MSYCAYVQVWIGFNIGLDCMCLIFKIRFENQSNPIKILGFCSVIIMVCIELDLYMNAYKLMFIRNFDVMSAFYSHTSVCIILCVCVYMDA
jgi:hypothetical protein